MAKNFVIINGHRIVNIGWMQIACEKTQRTLGVKTVIFDPAYMSKEIVSKLGFGPVGHAEEIESSHMLHSYPELYHAERVLDYVPEPKPLFSADPRFQEILYAMSRLQWRTCESPSKSPKERQAVPPDPVGKRKEYHEHLVERLLQ